MEPIADREKIRVGVNGRGVTGKRVAVAVARQEDMSLAGVSDVATDWRAGTPLRNGFRLFGATAEYAGAMRAAGLDVTGTLDELLGQENAIDEVLACRKLTVCGEVAERLKAAVC